MPYGERAELIERLIADSAKALDPKIGKTWGDEALRRLTDLENARVKAISGEQVMAEVRKIVGLK